MGRASAMESGPPLRSPRGSWIPMENSPPGIHAIPSGAELGAGLRLGFVGMKDASATWDGATLRPPPEWVNATTPATTPASSTRAANMTMRCEGRRPRCNLLMQLRVRSFVALSVHPRRILMPAQKWRLAPIKLRGDQVDLSRITGTTNRWQPARRTPHPTEERNLPLPSKRIILKAVSKTTQKA